MISSAAIPAIRRLISHEINRMGVKADHRYAFTVFLRRRQTTCEASSVLQRCTCDGRDQIIQIVNVYKDGPNGEVVASVGPWSKPITLEAA